MSPAHVAREAHRRYTDYDALVHAVVVLFVVVAATIYAAVTAPHNQEAGDSVWFVYSAAIGYAAGRSGARNSQRMTIDTGEN